MTYKSSLNHKSNRTTFLEQPYKQQRERSMSLNIEPIGWSPPHSPSPQQEVRVQSTSQ
jgi:hypothetical protein